MNASRELDALVAEKVMGWTDLGPRWSDSNNSGYRWMRSDKKLLTEPEFEPSTDIAADYDVHRTVCGWLFSKRQAYFRALDRVIQARHPIPGCTIAWPDALAYYEVGDFSRAALTALGVEALCST